MRQYILPEAHIRTDEHGAYQGLDQEYASHRKVLHSQGEYVNGDAHTNTLEGAFSLFKRQIVWAHHHVSPQHLDRYWTEFQFKYNSRQVDDGTRTISAIGATEGKRLRYKEPRTN